MERSVVNFCPPNQEQVTQIRFYRSTIKAGVRTNVQLYNFTELFFGHDGVGAELARGFFPQKAEARRRGKTEGLSRLLHYYCIRQLSLVEVDYEMEFGHA